MQSEHPLEVDIWRVRTSGTTVRLRDVDKLLPADELERASRFHFERDRTRYIAAHIALHRIIRRYVRLEAAPISFPTMPDGKPFIEHSLNPSRISFNLSHSEDFALIAIARNVDLGVDIEKHRGNIEYAEISRRFFTGAECRWLDALPEPQRIRGFFRLWAAKEAFLKAVGTGLATPLNEVAVQFEDDQRIEFESTRPGVSVEGFGKELTIAPDYAAAVVLISGEARRTTFDVRHFDFEAGSGADFEADWG
jgi:4'-phosphopantetheinyl transferase